MEWMVPILELLDPIDSWARDEQQRNVIRNIFIRGLERPESKWIFDYMSDKGNNNELGVMRLIKSHPPHLRWPISHMCMSDPERM